MREILSVKIVRHSLIVTVVIFLMSTQAIGETQKTPQSNGSSTNKPEQFPKIAPVPSRPAAPGPSSFRPDMTFADAINILRYSTSPPLNIAVIWRDLEENADIYRDTPIGIEGLSGISLRMHLKLLLMGVSAGSPTEIGYTVDDGVIIIATKESLPVRMKARIYDVTDLVAPPANYFFLSSPGILFGIPIGGYGGFGLGGNYGTGYQGAGAGIYPGGFGGGLTGLLQNQYGTGGRSYRNYNSTRSTR